MRKLLMPFLVMAIMLTASMGLKAQNAVENYVSASGLVLFHVPSYYTGGDGYAFDFETDYDAGHILNWNVIDADGDGYNWMLGALGEGYGHNGSDGLLLSYSYNYSSHVALHPDNYVVSPALDITNSNKTMTFFACALDEDYPEDRFGVAVSTTSDLDPSAFTVLQEWVMTSKQGGWHQYSVDLSAYVGQQVFVAIRHFNCTDNFCLCVDDIIFNDGNLIPLSRCSIVLDETIVEQNASGHVYPLNTAGFAENSVHHTLIKGEYQSGVILESECEWTYRTSDDFLGSPTGLQVQSNGDQVELSWSLPQMEGSGASGDLYYDFSDSTFSNLTLIDANNDGQNFRIFPYGGHGGGLCLRSYSWMSGDLGNLNPDNYLVLPRVTPSDNTRFSFYASDADMPGIAPDPEHFGVAVSTAGNSDPSDFTMLCEWNSTGNYTEYSVDLSEYAGQQIYIAIRHFNTSGECYFLNVDDIRLTNIASVENAMAIGAVVYCNDAVVALLNHGENTFIHQLNRYDANYCIRIIQNGSMEDGSYYALSAPQCVNVDVNCVAPKNLSVDIVNNQVRLSWEREIYTGFEEDPQGWAMLDADGDGYTFSFYYGGGMNSDGSVNTTNTNASMASFSYMNGVGELHPDNYAFMPKIKVLENAKLSFYAAGWDPNYPSEHFGVAIANADATVVETIAEWNTSNPYAKYEVDLSSYEGEEIFLGFRHFTNVANYALCIDNVTVTNAVWAGTDLETVQYNVYRSSDGQNYELIGTVLPPRMSYIDDEVRTAYYYKVTAVNSISGNDTCESDPALAVDGLHDFVSVIVNGVEEKKEGVAVFPNPTAGMITVHAEGMTHLMVMDAMGQVVMDRSVESDDTTFDLSSYKQGVYLVRVETGDAVMVRRVMLSR